MKCSVFLAVLLLAATAAAQTRGGSFGGRSWGNRGPTPRATAPAATGRSSLLGSGGVNRAPTRRTLWAPPPRPVRVAARPATVVRVVRVEPRRSSTFGWSWGASPAAPHPAHGPIAREPAGPASPLEIACGSGFLLLFLGFLGAMALGKLPR